jgi:hypothetical protein
MSGQPEPVLNTETLGLTDREKSDAVIEKAVDEELVYVKLANGTLKTFTPDRFLVRSSGKIKPYTGEPFRELGIATGCGVVVVGKGIRDEHERLLVDKLAFPLHKSSFFKFK